MSFNDSAVTDLDEYAESYHHKKALEQEGSIEITWQVKSMSAAVGKPILHLLLELEGELAVLILKKKQIAEFCEQYPEIFDYCSEDVETEDRPPFIVDIIRHKDEAFVKGVSNSVQLSEPDVAFVETDAELTGDPKAIKIRLDRELWFKTYFQRFNGGNPLETKLETEINDGKLLVTPRDADFNSYSWEYPSPPDIDEATEKLIETAGGDPRFIEDTSVYLLPKESCAKDADIRINEIGFGLVPKPMYNSWKSSNDSFWSKLKGIFS